MCVLACTDSALHNGDADTDGEGSVVDKDKTKGHPRTLSAWCAGVCGGSGRFGENRSCSNFLHDMEEQGFEENYLVYVLGPKRTHVETLLTWQNTRGPCCAKS